ncbi:ABC-2 type transport system permease protein [Bacillus pakistanensis]|uniref:ABC-2 type transport system permease protein n=1 Tax=Rossellomorea pakistanensis TaxID=992288 RepID=A0ABS2NJM0_9BACI|nr:ABC transporter permease [Bacillus pakistanensis]MBM7588062.1 ABC-2 type transport system permease protein [Bacillus pakistanensis]
MNGILLAKFRLFIRKPWTFIFMSLFCVLFALFTSQGNIGQVTVPVYSDLPNGKDHPIVMSLEESDAYIFEYMEKAEVNELVSEGKREVGVYLMDDRYQLIIASESENIKLVEQFIGSIYQKTNQVKSVMAVADTDKQRQEIETIMKDSKDPLFTIEKENFRGEGTVIFDRKLQGLFGFTLFFVIYTIAFTVLHILEEKQWRVWDRMILSPLKKWQMYAANLVYSFILGYVQILLVFLVFRYISDVHFYGGFSKTLIVLVPYVFAIVALSMLITGLVKTVQQFNAVIPLVAVSMAMIGGAYWPLEIVSSDILLGLSKVVPITYGIELLKGVTVYGQSISTVLFPISILLLMGVLMMGIGINLMERRGT